MSEIQQHGNTVRVDFSGRAKLKALGLGLYQLEGDNRFWGRPRMKGKQRKVLLKAKNQKEAIKELGRLEDKITQFENGLAPNPFVREDKSSMAELIQLYLDKGCPGRKRGTGGSEKTIRGEKKHAETILKWPGAKTAGDSFGPELREQYQRWRVKSIMKGRTGDRQIDRELQTMSSVFRISILNAKKTGITVNPLLDREHFCKAASVRHCRSCAPKNGDELHTLARYLFQFKKSEVLGWQLLLEALVGQRTHEILKLRVDAKPEEPGFVDEKRKCLFLFRSASSKGTFEYCELETIRTHSHRISTPLGECLKAFHEWHRSRFPKSPHFFPSPDDPDNTVCVSSLTHALRRIVKVVEQGPRTSHGLRSYFVNVLRSHRVPDGEVALRIGQKTGGKLIVEVYGTVPADTLTWLPSEGRPAWDYFSTPIPGWVNEEQLTLGL